MRSLEIRAQAPQVAPNVHFETDRERPEPQPGEVLVRTEATALNQLDLWVGRGVPGFEVVYPARSGADGVGIVEAVGSGTSEKWIGQRVVLNAAVQLPDPIEPDTRPLPPSFEMIGEHRTGTHAEYFVAPVSNVLSIGDADPVQAAAFGLVHLTAWRMLHSRVKLLPGSTVLVTGIGGGVASAVGRSVRPALPHPRTGRR